MLSSFGSLFQFPDCAIDYTDWIITCTGCWDFLNWFQRSDILKRWSKRWIKRSILSSITVIHYWKRWARVQVHLFIELNASRLMKLWQSKYWTWTTATAVWYAFVVSLEFLMDHCCIFLVHRCSVMLMETIMCVQNMNSFTFFRCTFSFSRLFIKCSVCIRMNSDLRNHLQISSSCLSMRFWFELSNKLSQPRRC